MARDEDPVSLEEMAHIQEIDEQIDQRLGAGISEQPSQRETLKQPFIQELHDFYQPQAEAIHQALDNVWLRLEQRSASPVQPDQQEMLAVSGNLDGTEQPAPRALAPWKQYTRLNTLVAAALLIVLVGGLVAGLILVRRPGSATTGGSLNVYISGGQGVYKLDASTGALRLSYTSIHGVVAAAPVVDNGVLYFSVQGDGIYAINAGNGSLLWYTPMSKHAGSSPLVVANGLVYFSGANDGSLYALNATDGTVGWRYPMPESAFVAVADGTLYISAIDPATNETDLYALNASKGTLLWHVPIAQQGLPNIMPVVANGVVYFTASGSSVQNGIQEQYSLAYAFNAKNGKLLWRSQSFPTFLTTPPTVANGVLYVGTQHGMYALKASDGFLLWEYNAGGQVSAPLQVVDGIIYAGVWQKDASSDGVMLALDTKDRSIRWKASIPGYTGYDQQYAVLNGVLYVTAGGYAYALDTADGTTLWRTKFSAPFPLGGALTVAP